jgi:hypothetical protein
MGYRIVGEIMKDARALDLKITPYKSSIFNTQEEALSYAYKKVYRKNGNDKRSRNVLINFYIEDA